MSFTLDTIYCGNSVNIMKEQIPDESVDLTVTSPPYDDMRSYKGYIFEVDKMAEQLFRITKHGGVVVWVVGDKTINGSETLTSFEHAFAFKKVGFGVETMIYKKAGQNFPSKYFYNQNFEYMFVFTKGNFPKTFNPIFDKENKWAGVGRWGKNTKRTVNGDLKENKNDDDYIIPPLGKRNNVWEYATGYGNTTRDKFAFEHPAMFPEKLAEDCIISWTNQNDVVLDPMCGAGTTLKMAKKNGRKYIGIDISPEYCRISNQRVKF